MSVGLGEDEAITDVVNTRAVAAARDQAALMVSRVTDATRDMIRADVASGLEDNAGLDEIADGLSDSYAFSEERARLIAATEIRNANSIGALESYREAAASGVRVKKSWIITTEACPVCQANADAGPIELDEAFPSGDTEPGAHPRCRCAVAPVVEAEEEEETSGEDLEAVAKSAGASSPATRGLAEPPSVSYVDHSYVDHSYGGRCCAGCSMFRSVPGKFLGRCEVVDVSANPAGWCEEWEPASSA